MLRRGILTGLVALFGLGALAPGAVANRAPLPVEPTYEAQLRVTTDFAGGTDLIRAVVAQPDGRVVAAGEARFSGQQRMALARYLPDGSLDPSFGDHGRVTTIVGGPATSASALALQPDGRLVAAGAAIVPGRLDAEFVLTRYLPDGHLDPTFGTAGVVTTDFGVGSDYAHAVAVLPDGDVVASGFSSESDGVFALARYLPDGRLDPTFGHGGLVTTDLATGPDEADAILAAPDGTLVAVGPAHADGNTGLVRYRLDGSLDPTFGTGGIVLGPGTGLSAALQPDGRILVVGGGSGFEPPAMVARFLPDGTPDATFGDFGRATIPIGRQALFHAVLLQRDGKFVAAGTADTGPGAFRFAVARFNPDGSPDRSFGPVQLTDFTLQTDEAFGIAVDPAGHIVAGGTSGFGYGNMNCDFALTGLGPLPLPSVPGPPITAAAPVGGSRPPGAPTAPNPVTPFPVVGGPAGLAAAAPARHAPPSSPRPVASAGASAAAALAPTTRHEPSDPLAAADPAAPTGVDQPGATTETLAEVNAVAAARTSPAPKTLPAPAVIAATLAAAAVAMANAVAFRRRLGARSVRVRRP